jgi:hypothetical protein
MQLAGISETGRSTLLRQRVHACLLLATVAAALVFLLPAARSEADAPTNVAIGDSITHVSSDEILNRFFAAGWPGAVIGIDSQRIDQMRPYIQYVAGYTPNLRRMFIFLGTNDAWQFNNGTFRLDWSIDELHAAVHDVIDRRPKACVFLTTIKAFNFPTAPRFYLAATALNNEMKKIDAAFPRVFLIDWNQLSNNKPWFADFIGHPNQAGQNALADFYRWFGTTADTPSRPCGPIPHGVS